LKKLLVQIGTNYVATCGTIEIQAVETWNSSAFSNKFSYLFGRCHRLRSVILSSSINKTA